MLEGIRWNSLGLLNTIIQVEAQVQTNNIPIGPIPVRNPSGILGDWFASRWPLHGRALVGQMSIALGAVPLLPGLQKQQLF